MSVAEMNASSLLDKMKTLPEDVQVKLGYMIEGAALLATSRTLNLNLTFAFDDLRAVSVIAKINPENTRSRRLAAACGFREVGPSGEMTLFQAKCG